MQTSAAALTSIAKASSKSAAAAGSAGAPASDFLRLVAGDGAVAKKAKTPAASAAVPTGPAAKGAAAGEAGTGANAELAAKAAPKKKAAITLAAPKRSDEGAGPVEVMRMDVAKAAEARIPAALALAVAAGAAGSSARTDVPEAAATAPSADPSVQPPAKAKPARTAAIVTKHDARESSAPADKSPESDRARTAPPTDAGQSLKAEKQPAAIRPVDPQSGDGVAKGTEPEPAAAAPADAKASGEIRISLSREVAAHAGVAAPMLAVRIHTKGGATRAIEIRLDPPDLGQVDVRLETGSDGRLKAVLQAETSQAFELLKRESGALEAALRDAGVELGDEGLSFALNDGGSGSDSAQQRDKSYAGASDRRDDAVLSAAVAVTTWRDGVVDISV